MELGLVVLALGMLVLSPGVALSAAVPDSAGFERLRTVAMAQNRFRIVTDHGEFMMMTLHVDAEGVVVHAPPEHPALIVLSKPDPAETRRASWDAVQGIEGMRSHSLRDAMLGGLVGGLMGLGVKQMFEGNLHDASNAAILLIPTGAVVGGVIGAIAGSTTGWRPLYP